MRIAGIDFLRGNGDEIQWTPDTQDKQDFDFPVVKVLTRYYGRDCTAMPTIYLGDEVLARPIDYIRGEDELDCKRKTEEWIRKEVNFIVGRLINEKDKLNCRNG